MDEKLNNKEEEKKNPGRRESPEDREYCTAGPKGFDREGENGE